VRAHAPPASAVPGQPGVTRLVQLQVGRASS
jgi:hypothetical protein